MPSLTHNELRAILPQAYPFLMIDRVTDYKAGESLTAIKNITANEWLFEEPTLNGTTPSESQHFPETLLIEAAAQAALVLYEVSRKERLTKNNYFIGKINGEFSQAVDIGDQLNIHVTSGRMLSTGGYVDAKLSSNAKDLAQLELIFKVHPV